MQQAVMSNSKSLAVSLSLEFRKIANNEIQLALPSAIHNIFIIIIIIIIIVVVVVVIVNLQTQYK